MRSLALLGLALLVVACGPSAQQKVDAYLAKRKSPGMLRLVNLTDQPAMLRISKPFAEAPVAGNKDSRFFPILSGTTHVEVLLGTVTVASEDIPVDQKVAMTYVLADAKGKPQLIKDEILHTGEPNASVRIVGLEGVQGLVAEIKDPAGKESTADVSSAQPKEGASGKYSITLKDKAGKTVANAELEAEAGMAYTVIVTSSGKGVKAQPFLNTPHDKPLATGVSGA